jgi:hypothetical protein
MLVGRKEERDRVHWKVANKSGYILDWIVPFTVVKELA